MYLKPLQFFVLSYIALHYASASTDKVICYYQSWASGFSPSDIDADICTHVNYAFVGIKSDGSLHLASGDSTVKKLRDLKKKNPKLKLLFSVGGWSEGSKTFSAVASSGTKKNKMASSALDLLKTHKFDGIDIDWEYPGQRGGKSADKKNFVDMLKVIHKKLKDNGKYLLTIAVGSSPDSGSYDVSKIANIVDFINVMTYDFNGGSDGKTGLNAPLHSSSKDSDWVKKNGNTEAAIKLWKDKGAPGSKLILGLPFYGYSFKLKNAKKHGVGDEITKSNGQLPYSEICKLKSGWKVVWDSERKVPYKYKGTTWISYDNPTSIKQKVQFAKKKKLGGVMMWAVDQDDKNGSCGTKLALLKEIKKAL